MKAFKTEFRDRELVLEALSMVDAKYEFERGRMKVTSPVSAIVRLKDGLVTVADDPDTEAFVRRLQQLYAEAKVRRELNRNDGYVEARTVDEAGNITLMCAFDR